ncbi:MAG TPA: F0F1 ATP synthase subunit delta [Candidatus Paceibacterota bacterium]|nr:F0F1 ATP synthase subunit delta [Candidatus Paceibacterota bacterium]
MIDTYTRLLEAVAETEDKAAADAAVTKLIVHLKSAGRMNILPKIARELRKVASRRHALRPRVEVASEKESAGALAAAAALGIDAKRATVNHSLIRGWRAQSEGKLIDRSAKHALAKIYQKVTV